MSLLCAEKANAFSSGDAYFQQHGRNILSYEGRSRSDSRVPKCFGKKIPDTASKPQHRLVGSGFWKLWIGKTEV